MKIGIMTFWWSEDNYGQVLQCYALQKYLRDLGHDAYLIRYRYETDLIKSLAARLLKILNPLLLYTYLKNKKRLHTIAAEQKLNSRKFDEFRAQYIKQSVSVYTSYAELKSNPPEADCYIAGSDQVWSCILSPITSYKNVANAYFLNFGSDQTKRIAYAASWGTDTISEEYIELITPLIKKFNVISVREKTGIELCSKCGYENAVCCPDPTFLIDAQIYFNEIAETAECKTEKYIVLYMLNNTYDFDLNKVFSWAKEKHLTVQFITGNGLADKHRKTFASIAEWLSLIKNAEYVITNSFHCSIFSILAGKSFAVIPLSGRYEGLNSRMISLFELCGIESRFIRDYDFNLLEKKYSCDVTKIQRHAQNCINGFLI